jgi:cytochrome c oxidase assembly factor CtaG
MSVWKDIAAPLCIALTAAGLLLSGLRWRRRGVRRGLRAVAWSVLPLAAYLSGSVPLIGNIGSAIASAAGSFVFSTRSWAGVILFGAAALLFVTTGGLPLLRRRKPRAKDKQAAAVGPAAGAQPPAVAAKGRRAAAADDDLSDVEEILRRRGIQ